MKLNLEKILSLWSLTKPRLSNLVLFASGAGLHLAPGQISLWRTIFTLLGTLLIVGAANSLNCFMEINADARMPRTQKRVLVTGKVSPHEALLFGVLLALVASILLAFAANVLTAFLGLFGFVIYVGFYTPMKRFSMMALFMGAIPGAIPPMMGWTAVTNHIGLGAWLLFALLFMWQLPHFLAIALRYQHEYEAAGFRTYPTVLGRRSAELHMIIYSIILILVSFLPFILGLADQYYFITAAFLGVLFASLSIANLLKIKKWKWNRLVFFGSIVYLPLILGMWVFDSWIQTGVLR